MNDKLEMWLRGPVADIPALLQPAAHALLQSLLEIKKYTADLPEELIHTKPYGRASVAFHLKHITGVLDRLMTYSKGEALSKDQLEYLKNEGNSSENDQIQSLITAFEAKVNEALALFKITAQDTLTEKRYVGRKKLPSTLIGLFFHAAEHSQRHVGQLLVTVTFLKAQ
ncbi:MAG: DinB family protein [Leeuwenhoekiella sp.]